MNLISIPFLVAILAEADAFGGFGMLAQYGPMGVMLLWFMFRVEPRLKCIEEAIDRSSRASLVIAMASTHMGHDAAALTQGVINEIDAADKKRA